MLLFLCSAILTDAKAPSIQEQIDQAKPGETIELTTGEYVENIIINKPIHFIGTGEVTLIQEDSNPVITIKSNGVVIENLSIKLVDKSDASAAILILSDYNSLHDIYIHTDSFGIQFDEAHDNDLSNIHITGNKDAEIKDRKHGIDLWKSHNNVIKDSRIKHVQDGIYVEKSHENTIHHTVISHSRYGSHLMFTKNTVLEGNESYENISGMYIMGANGTIAKHNILRDNQKNIHSLGMLLFDTVNAKITDNDILNNRIGIFVEDARDNTLASNHIQGNYIGIQFKGAENNEINHNAFIANVVHGQAKDSSTNHTNQNYWGDHFGLDITGDNRSNLPYKVDPFFLHVTNEYPPFQLLFQAPGMFFMEELISTPVEEQLVDASPLMENPLVTTDNLSSNQLMTLLLFCITLIFLSTFIIYLGVKKQ